MNSPNKLQCYITLVWKGLPVANTLTYWAHSQYFIFFVTNEQPKQATTLHYTSLERPACDKHSYLLDPFTALHFLHNLRMGLLS
jgi:hypothetical protein